MLARFGVEAQVQQPTDLLVRPLADTWDSDQYAINWFEPAGSGPPVLPPGIDRMPEPGVAVVSPALRDLFEREPDMAARYPHYVVLGKQGLADEGERIAWIRPTDPERLTAGFHTRIADFGVPDRATPGWSFSIAEPMERLGLALALGILLVLPGVLLLFVGLATSSQLRESRFLTMRMLGAGWRWMTKLALLESLLLAIPGMVLAFVGWIVLASRLGTLPLVGKDVLTGDLAIRPAQGVVALAAFFVTTIAVVIVLGVLPAIVTRFQRRTASRAMRAVGIGLRILPMAAAVGYAIVGGATGGAAGMRTLLYAISALLLFVPLAAPALGRPFGHWLAGAESLSAMIAGRRLERDPVHALRPFLALGALIIVACMTVGMLTLLRQNDPGFLSGRAPSMATLGVNRLPKGDITLQTLQQRLPDDLITLMTEAYAEHGTTLIIGAPCVDVAAFLEVPAETCPAGTARVPAADLNLEALYSEIAFDPSITSRPQQDLSYAVFSDDTSDALERRIRRVAPLAEFPGLNITTVEHSILGEPVTATWLDQGTRLTLLLAGLASLFAMVDRVIALRHERSTLVFLGITPGTMRRIELVAFLIPFATVSVLALAIGVINIMALDGVSGFPFPFAAVGSIVLLLGVAGLVAGSAVSMLGGGGTLDRHVDVRSRHDR